MADERPGSTDVLIVGAGPVGLMLAAELQRYGATCRIVDRAPQPTDTSKAVIVHARMIEHLDHLGLEHTFLAGGTMVHSVSFFAQAKRVAQLDFDDSDTRYPFVLCIPQHTTENILADRLAEGGLQVERPVEFIDFRQDDGGVTSRLRHPDGPPRRPRPPAKRRRRLRLASGCYAVRRQPNPARCAARRIRVPSARPPPPVVA